MRSWVGARQTTDLSDAMRRLVGARSGGTDTDVDLAGLALDHVEGLKLQLEVLDALLEGGETLAGWKVSYTSGGARDKMGKGFRPFGYLLSSHVFPSGATLNSRRFRNMAVEPELCLRLAEPLEGYVTPKEARQAVGAVIPSFELNEIRYLPNADDGTVLADGCGQWGVVIGDEAPVIGGVSDLVVRLREGEIVRASAGPNHVIDDPFRSLAALAAGLAPFGRSLRPGDLVITGSFARSEVPGPSRWSASFEGIGAVTVTFDDQR